MAVYVDECFQWPGKAGWWCHMATDNDDLEELHKFAARMGLKRAWFQNRPNLPHYDLRGVAKRREAVGLGAQPVTGAELVRHCRKPPLLWPAAPPPPAAADGAGAGDGER